MESVDSRDLASARSGGIMSLGFQIIEKKIKKTRKKTTTAMIQIQRELTIIKVKRDARQARKKKTRRTKQKEMSKDVKNVNKNESGIARNVMLIAIANVKRSSYQNLPRQRDRNNKRRGEKITRNTRKEKSNNRRRNNERIAKRVEGSILSLLFVKADGKNLFCMLSNNQTLMRYKNYLCLIFCSMKGIE